MKWGAQFRKACPRCDGWSEKVYRCSECGADIAGAVTEVQRR